MGFKDGYDFTAHMAGTWNMFDFIELFFWFTASKEMNISLYILFNEISSPLKNSNPIKAF